MSHKKVIKQSKLILFNSNQLNHCMANLWKQNYIGNKMIIKLSDTHVLPPRIFGNVNETKQLNLNFKIITFGG